MEKRSTCVRREMIFLQPAIRFIKPQKGPPLPLRWSPAPAATLWAINPDLSAEKVRELLLENAAVMCYASDDQSGSYPMLNVGLAVKALIDEMNGEQVCAVYVMDADTGEPIEGATVTLMDFSIFSSMPDLNEISNPQDAFSTAEQITDANGTPSCGGIRKKAIRRSLQPPAMENGAAGWTPVWF